MLLNTMYCLRQDMTLRKLLPLPSAVSGDILKSSLESSTAKRQGSMEIDAPLGETAIINEQLTMLRLKTDDMTMIVEHSAATKA
jgi:hypothetical protein